MTKDEAMKLALEALEHWMRIDTVEDMHIFETVTAPEAIAVLRQALEQPEQVSVPDGWKLVPIEPTDAMLSVPVNIDLRECVTPGGVTGLDAVGLFRAWEAMIEAAPQPWDTTDMAHRTGGLSMEQKPVDSPEKAGAYMDARLWEFIYMAAAWPEAKTDTRIWDHVLVYARKRPEQETVAWNMKYNRYPKEGDLLSQIRLVSRREWVGLTDEDRYKAIRPLYNSDENARLAVEHSNDEYEAIEAKLKEKNSG